MKWLKNNWFGLFIGTFLLIFLAYFIILATSPRHDLEKRGFIPCTEKMAADIAGCSKKTFCAFGAILRSNFCNFGIICQGFKNWSNGTQPTPWSNYYFTPVLSNENEIYDFIAKEDDQEAVELAQDMKEIIKLNKELEHNEQK